MKLAINYSYPAAFLVASRKIQVDYFKTPGWPDLIEQAARLRPVALHFQLDAGAGRLGHQNWLEFDRWLKRTSTPFINLHLSSSEEVATLTGQKAVTEVNPLMEVHSLSDCVLEKLLTDVQSAVRFFGADRVIVENDPYRRPERLASRAAALPQTIAAVIEKTGCGLLLDLAHARISAYNLGMTPEEYLAALPLHRLCEMHFSGVQTIDGLLQDHYAAEEEDWRLLHWALNQIRAHKWSTPWLLAFEYGGVGKKFAHRSDSGVILEQSRRLWDMLHEV